MPCAGFERAALRVTVSSGALSDRVNERRVKVKTFFRHALGVFLSVTLTASLFTICAKTVSAAGETEKIKVACVGDSITQGQGTDFSGNSGIDGCFFFSSMLSSYFKNISSCIKHELRL